MKLRLETGHRVSGDVKRLEETRIRFVAEDGLTVFEVTALDDGKSIQIRGIEATKIGGVLHSANLAVKPNAANSIDVFVTKYE